MSEKLADYSVKVHRSKDSNLDFINKNFEYANYRFDEFLKECESGPNCLYLRSIGNDKRGRDVSDIKKHFPTIADDLIFPEFVDFCQDTSCDDCDKRHLFSSVFRISSKDILIWMHYDVMDNILLQVKGSKTVTLFPPNDAPYLYLNGDKSEIIDINQSDVLKKYPLLQNATKYECILNESDALFIPAMWFHTTKALEFSIGVNFFWKTANLLDLYNKTDVYANKDLVPASDAYSNIDKALKHLSKLPVKYKNFYISMIISRLARELNKQN